MVSVLPLNCIVDENPGKCIVCQNKIFSLSENINLHLNLTSKTDCFPSISICCIPRGINSRLPQLVETVPRLGKNKEKKTKKIKNKKKSWVIIIDYS